MTAALQVSLILWGWLLAQFPLIVPPDVTIGDAAAPAVTLRLLLIGIGVGAVLLLPSLWYLYRTFARAVEE